MIKCSCGNKGCNRVVYLDVGLGYINLSIANGEEVKEGDTSRKSVSTISLMPNEIFQLIRELKSSLNKLE
jgi:hypothetical protein